RDWSSDVCSPALPLGLLSRRRQINAARRPRLGIGDRRRAVPSENYLPRFLHRLRGRRLVFNRLGTFRDGLALGSFFVCVAVACGGGLVFPAVPGGVGIGFGWLAIAVPCAPRCQVCDGGIRAIVVRSE